MRLILVALALVACKKPRDAGPGSAALPRPIDAAPLADAYVPDAYVPDAPADAAPDARPVRVTKKEVKNLLDWETLGPLKLGMDEHQVLALLGEPKDKSISDEPEGATGEFVGSWEWTGVSVGMSADKRTGPFHVRSIELTAPSDFATSRGIHIGSTVAEVSQIYPRSAESVQNPTDYLVGSVYGGMLFSTQAGKVSSVFLGAMAF